MPYDAPPHRMITHTSGSLKVRLPGNGDVCLGQPSMYSVRSDETDHTIKYMDTYRSTEPKDHSTQTVGTRALAGGLAYGKSPQAVSLSRARAGGLTYGKLPQAHLNRAQANCLT